MQSISHYRKLILALLPALLLGGCLHSRPVVSEKVAADALAEAFRYVNLQYTYRGKTYRGVPYLWGGQDDPDSFSRKIAAGSELWKRGVDCSGLVINVYRKAYPGLKFSLGNAGLVSDIDAENLYRYNTLSAALDELRPGDLLFFGSKDKGITHVALFVKKKGSIITIVHAASRKKRAVRQNISIRDSWWRSSFVDCGRLSVPIP